MRLTSFLFSLIALGLILGSCNKDPEPKPMNLSEKALKVIGSSNDFGLDLYQRVVNYADADKNVMISPLSISQALSMTYNGAAGTTRNAFELTLRTGELSRDDFNVYNKELVSALLAHDPKVILEIANSIWYRQEYEVLADFTDRNQVYYNAEVKPSDFNDPLTLGKINGWVDEKTHHKIEKIIDQINPESFMFLINAIYFKGTWEFEFDKKDTRNQDFMLANGSTVSVPMMNREMDINMLQNDLFSSVELPYGKGNWSMLMFLPNHDKNLDDLVAALTPTNWDNWMKAYQLASEVDVTIPKFQFAFEQNLNNPLIDMGLGVAFTSEADFGDMAPGLPLQISKVLHKSFIDVNEEGTEAAAVTSVEIELTSMGNYFYANRPFLFAIVEQSTGAILFIGQVRDPSLKE